MISKLKCSYPLFVSSVGVLLPAFSFVGARKPDLFNIYREAILSTSPLLILIKVTMCVPCINISDSEHKCRDSKVFL